MGMLKTLTLVLAMALSASVLSAPPSESPVDGATPAELAPSNDSGGPAYIHDDSAMGPAPVPGFASLKASEHAVEASVFRFGPAALVVDPESPWRWSFGIETNEQEDRSELVEIDQCIAMQRRRLEDSKGMLLDEDGGISPWAHSFASGEEEGESIRQIRDLCENTYSPPYYTPTYSPPYRFSVYCVVCTWVGVVLVSFSRCAVPKILNFSCVCFFPLISPPSTSDQCLTLAQRRLGDSKGVLRDEVGGIYPWAHSFEIGEDEGDSIGKTTFVR